MGRFLLFVGLVLILSLAGLLVYWVWSKIDISIQRRNSLFEIEKETHEKIKEDIKEEM
ncbi:hypothetical protein H8S37_04055 [Mediterraneibacter sp. NSJ-55]|uniref:Uncharacterized protein n=1 Tax=Mediterraneibacter hominis TaxID=2763054 RepID=A0A923LH93_9FIRM|nr:hypothetical protein [Mediterraneibacter hominis]MBC5688107.1 hypothetical protein [Mediterraneibacter hominis]